MTATFIISGRIGNIGELQTAGNYDFCTISIPENIRTQKGDTKTQWHYLTLWGQEARNAQKYLRKGSVVSAACSISYNKREDIRYTNINVKEINYLANYGDPNKKSKRS